MLLSLMAVVACLPRCGLLYSSQVEPARLSVATKGDSSATVQALGQGQRPLDPQGILSVESLMDEIIDRAYDEDDEMGVRDVSSPLHAHSSNGHHVCHS